MLTSENIQAVKDCVSSAQTILVIFPANTKPDHAASALSLFLALQGMGKNVSLATPLPVAESLQTLHGWKHASQELGNKNLQISFDYQEDMVDKVSYHIDEEAQKFNLVIQPKKNARPLDSKTVEFSYTGAEADVIFLVGVRNYQSLEQLYIGYEDLFANTTTVSIQSYETEFGSIKLDTSGSPSFSESMAYLIQEIGGEISAEVATNLLAGIEEATDSFRSLSATATTFEIAAQLLKAGARRMARQNKPIASAAAGVPSSVNSANGFSQALAKVGTKNITPTTSQPQASPIRQLQQTSTPNVSKAKSSKSGNVNPANMPRQSEGSRL